MTDTDDTIGPAGLGDQREFARIDVRLPVRVQPLDPERAELLRVELLEAASVWCPTDEAVLRDLAASSHGGTEARLAQAVLELSHQVSRLRARVLEPDGPVLEATIVQLSGGGGKLVSELPLAEGDQFELRFEDEGDVVPPIHAVARVVHHDPASDERGFAFETIHPRDQERLIRMIYQLQRRELRRARSGD